MGKHTPGPWNYLKHTRSEYGDVGWCSFGVRGPAGVGGCELQLATVVSDCIEDHEANARLIAAAPELLEACQTFAEWLRREEGGFPAETRFNTPEGEAKWREWFDENLRICDLAQTQARSAIAKARGEA